jgi:RNA polymerase sigma-70 factor (ECF subfamily)
VSDGEPAAAEEDDRALLQAWRRGDRERGNVLFRRHIKSVSRFFRSKIPEVAEDLTQSTFLAIAQLDVAKLGPEVAFRAYLFGVARNQLLMHLRGKMRADQRFDPLTWSAPDAGAGPVKMVARQQQASLVAAALQGVPVDYQVALELFYFEALSIAEIAAAMERPQGTIKSLLSRGRELLRERIEVLASGKAELLASAVGELDKWLGTLPAALSGDDEA